MSNQPAPWRWVIYDSADPDQHRAVRAHGVQHTRLYATAAEVAAERMAEVAYRAWTRDRLGDIGSLVCRVKRDGEPGWAASVPGEVWLRRLASSRR